MIFEFQTAGAKLAGALDSLAYDEDEARERGFLFAFDEEFDIHRETAGLFHEGFDRLDMHEHLALVVGSTTGVDFAVAYGRFLRD